MPHPPLSPFRRALLWGLAALLVHAPLASQPATKRAPTFDAVVTVLEGAYHDAAFRTSELPRLAAELRPRALQAASPAEERAVVWELLSHVPASHLALISSAGRSMLISELFNRPQPTLGFQLVRWEGRYFATMVLPGGPAATAGIRPWDEITSIDGVSPASSARLDWRTDDAFLPDVRDPPVHALLVREGETVRLGVAARPGAVREVAVPVRAWSALQGGRASVRSVVRDDVRIGYLRLFYLHITGVPELLEEALDGPLAGSDALVLDLRGRGGGAHVVQQVLRLLTDGPKRRFRGPVVALIDRQARSGKEALAYELRRQGAARLVGEPTAGAVIPASFVDVGEGAVLMFPQMTLPPYTDLLEGKPTPPDVAVAWGGPYSGDRDPILEAGLDEAVRMVRADGRGEVLPRSSAVATAPRQGSRRVRRAGPGVRAPSSPDMLAR
ncbi:MAG TPA: S41 family peptidase [Longimicrobium sp.]|jgi:C-terminal processing protease CtpA/Prc|nr:S41 family peptidase [Longimicrobium sp.]